jgi:argininosuccinate synthase
MLQLAIDHSQEHVNGEVKVKLYKGNIDIVGRRSSESLFDARTASFREDEGVYNQADADGFIKLNALRLRNLARKRP